MSESEAAVWLCDGSAEEGGCASQDVRIVTHWRCDACNFDMCDCCLMRRNRRADHTEPTNTDEEAEAALLRELEDEDDFSESSEAPPTPPTEEGEEEHDGSPRTMVVKDPLASVSESRRLFGVACVQKRAGDTLDSDNKASASPRSTVVTVSIQPVAGLRGVYS